MTQETFNQWHGAPDAGGAADRALLEFDKRIGGAWHGIPDGGVHNSWSERFWFRGSGGFDPRIALRSKQLESRLIRFTPYPVAGEPEDGPVDFKFHRKGAQAIVVRLFSPYNADVNRSFALIYSTNDEFVSRLINAQVGRASWFGRIWP